MVIEASIEYLHSKVLCSEHTAWASRETPNSCLRGLPQFSFCCYDKYHSQKQLGESGGLNKYHPHGLAHI